MSFLLFLVENRQLSITRLLYSTELDMVWIHSWIGLDWIVCLGENTVTRF